MSHALLCFVSTFVAVFALGLQSLNVNQGYRWAARLTSLLIGTSHIALYRFMPGASWLEVAAYLAGGVAGIDCSMWFHPAARAWLEARKSRKPGQRPPKAPMPTAAPLRGQWISSHHFMPYPAREACQVCGHSAAEHEYIPRKVGYAGDTH